jgi:aminoglycoside phosphotransferase (APT) family kinase protein
MPGGASRESWDIEVRRPGQAQGHLILLRDAGGRTRRPARSIEIEAAAMIAARSAGVPVADLYDHGERALGRAYLLMERLEGETIPRRLLRDDAYAAARPRLARRLGEVLARIHQIDPANVPGLPNTDALGQLTELYQGFAEPRPALEIGLRWLREHQPAPVADTLVHGDFRTGNLMVATDGLAGVLDWELTHRGDPRQDLGWLCTKAWRFGSPHPVGGFGSRDELMAGYAKGGGIPPDEATQRWWELYGTVRWALLCRSQAERYLSGAEPSVELAVLGRRVCEQEFDVLLALGHATPLHVPDPLQDREYPPVRPHDRPSGPALLAAVRDFLATEAGASDPVLKFHTRVAANALRIAEREALLAPAHEQAHRKRLAALGCRDDAELCAAIRDGSLDHRFADVAEAVTAAAVDKLTVANPAHLAIPE